MWYTNGLLKWDYGIIQINIYLEVRPIWDLIIILFVCNHFCLYKKETGYMIVIEKKKI